MTVRLRALGRRAEMEWPRRAEDEGRLPDVFAGAEAKGRLPEVLAGQDKVGRRAEDEGRPPDVLAGEEAEGRQLEDLAGEEMSLSARRRRVDRRRPSPARRRSAGTREPEAAVRQEKELWGAGIVFSRRMERIQREQ